MARPSKLSPAQWADAARMSLDGKSHGEIAKHFGVSRATITSGVSDRVTEIKNVAVQAVHAEQSLTDLPITDQLLAVSYMSSLRSMLSSLSKAGELGAKNAHRLHHLANSELQKVDDADPAAEKSINSLKTVAVLTKMANEAAVVPTALLSAHKEKVKEATVEVDPDAVQTHGVLMVPGLAESSAAWSANSRGAKA